MSKILLIEDDHNLGLMVKEILEFSDHNVTLSRKPESAIEMLKADSYDLLILDKLLMGIDGNTICKQIRETTAIKHIPILMMSALNDSKSSCLDAGATAFIYKPFDIEEFSDSVTKTLEN